MTLKEWAIRRPPIFLYLLLLRIERIKNSTILLIAANLRGIPRTTNREVGLGRRRHIFRGDAQGWIENEQSLRIPEAEARVLLIGIIGLGRWLIVSPATGHSSIP